MFRTALYSIAILASTLTGSALAQSQNSATTYKVVDPADLAIGSRKYLNRDIEVKAVQCYYADVNDFRCTTNELVSIFTPSITPEKAQKWIEEKCDQVKTAITSKSCSLRIRFRFSEDQVNQDVVSGYQKRTVIHPTSIEAVPRSR